MREAVIVGGARTAFGKFGGGLKQVSAVELGALAIKGAIQSAQIDNIIADAVLMGMALQAHAGQNPARQAARLAGLPWSIPSETINKVCASGMRAVTMADQMIRVGDADMIISGGMESMSNSPYATSVSRWGARMGNSELTDLLLHDGLLCAFANVRMVVHGSQSAAKYGISRQAQDVWAIRSHQRAVMAADLGLFAEEIIKLENEHSDHITADECPRRDTNLEKLARLKPLTEMDGTITAGNAPGVNDGAAALVLMSKRAAKQAGLKPLAKIVAHTSIGVSAPDFPAAPALVIRKLLTQSGYSLQDIDRFEVNEAFAAVVLICGQILGWDEEKVNVHGGAIALGHPLGASGARMVLTLIAELKRRGGGLGIAAICSGGGQGDAILLKVDR